MFGILGIIAIVAFTVYSYKTAIEFGRSGLWAAATFGIGILIQFVIPFVLGITFVMIMMAAGKTEEQIAGDYYGFSIVVELGSIVASVFAMLGILKYLSRIHDDDDNVEPLPKPPKFN